MEDVPKYRENIGKEFEKVLIDLVISNHKAEIELLNYFRKNNLELWGKIQNALNQYENKIQNKKTITAEYIADKPIEPVSERKLIISIENDVVLFENINDFKPLEFMGILHNAVSTADVLYKTKVMQLVEKASKSKG